MELDFLLTSGDTSSDGLTPRKLQDLIQYPPRPYRSLEIETTTRCNLSCPTCPRVRFRSNWIERDMSMDHYIRVARVFDRFETIHFRGWGEPLIHPCFPEMARMAYQSGARLVLTTNGSAAPPPGLVPYFEAIIFRLDYGQASTYERRNPGARFGRVMFNISQVLHNRDQAGGRRPQVLLLFVKNKYTLRELPSYLETALRLRPDRVVFYPAMFHVRGIDAQAQLPADIGPELIQHVDDRLARIAQSEGVDIINLPVTASEGCESNCPYASRPDLFINWRGMAAACRHSCLPVISGGYTRHIGSRVVPRENRYWGNLIDHDLDAIPTPTKPVVTPPCRLQTEPEKPDAQTHRWHRGHSEGRNGGHGRLNHRAVRLL
jgi:MoaA/NifB/PqqE/SkfB family radical SAM enzyme